jgi:hypothetical protein
VNLVRYEQARNALAECHRVDEVKDIRDKAEAMAAYARQAKDQDLILWATEIKVRAERRAGEMLREIPKAQGAKFNGRAPDGSFRQSHDDSAETLADMGVTPMQSSRWQALASMSNDHFEAAVATAKETAGQVTTAFMLREAAKLKPHKKLSDADRRRLEGVEKVKGNSMLAGYSRMVLKALREADGLSDSEVEILEALRNEINSALAH